MEKEKGRLEYIDVVRWQDGKIHVLGRNAERITSDGHFFRTHYIIHDSLTYEIIIEDSSIHKGNFPLFMCGCYPLSCEGDCPPLLDHELALSIYENRKNTEHYNESIRKFKEANSNDLRKKTQEVSHIQAADPQA